jgi:Lar family restriction alleviation protein
MTAALKPCPFCGYTPAVVEVKRARFDDGYSVECDHSACQCLGPMRDTPAEAIAAWNRRAAQSPT